MTLVLHDDDIRTHLTPTMALAAIREVLQLKSAGELQCPPRLNASLDTGKLVFTVGSTPRWFGYRAYDTLPTTHGQQVVVAHDAETGNVSAIAVGNALGALRTGAIGGVAAQALSGGTVRQVAVIGTGQQAATQLWALSAFAQPESIRIFSRTPDARTRFAQEVGDQFGIPTVSASSAREAVEGADCVILATNSGSPVIKTEWLIPDVVVTTLGPKQINRAEFAPDLVTDAIFVVTDSGTQLRSYDPPALMAETSMHELSDVVSGAIKPPMMGRRVFCSVGLAGSEVHLLGSLAQVLGE